MVVDRRAATPASGVVAHATVRDLPTWLEPEDLLIVNATRVVPARLRGKKSATGGAAEALLLEAVTDEPGVYRALVKTGGRLRTGLRFSFTRDGRSVEAEIRATSLQGGVLLAFPPETSPYDYGEPPLPPYIRRSAPDAADVDRYQTVFARVPGAVAAPTAGLHLSRSLLDAVAAKGVEIAEVVLHVGLGTFRPLDAAALANGRLHEERFELSAESASAIARTRARGGRVVAVGTTTTRVLETRKPFRFYISRLQKNKQFQESRVQFTVPGGKERIQFVRPLRVHIGRHLWAPNER